VKLKAADAIEAQDRHILTLQHEMMEEAKSHLVEVKRLNKQIEKLQANVRGMWLPDYDFAEYNFDGLKPQKYQDGWKCSLCGQYMPSITSYCPNCGADMRKPPKEE
jgi:rubrerythrin